MFGTLLYILAIWTALSFAVGLTWIILCFVRDGFSSTHRSRLPAGHRGKPNPYGIGRRSGSA
jgi:hypothetical protein